MFPIFSKCECGEKNNSPHFTAFLTKIHRLISTRVGLHVNVELLVIVVKMTCLNLKIRFFLLAGGVSEWFCMNCVQWEVFHMQVCHLLNYSRHSRQDTEWNSPALVQTHCMFSSSSSSKKPSLNIFTFFSNEIAYLLCSISYTFVCPFWALIQKTFLLYVYNFLRRDRIHFLLNIV